MVVCEKICVFRLPFLKRPEHIVLQIHFRSALGLYIYIRLILAPWLIRVLWRDKGAVWWRLFMVDKGAYTSTHCNAMFDKGVVSRIKSGWIAMCCSVLRYVAVCCTTAELLECEWSPADSALIRSTRKQVLQIHFRCILCIHIYIRPTLAPWLIRVLC